MTEHGLYIHIPFCEKRCEYCAFFSNVSSSEMIEKYVKVLVEEIVSIAKKNSDIKIKTIYIGGGTPSLLSEEQLSVLFDAIYKYFFVESDETTIEVNPNSSDKLYFYSTIGINRLSMGIQSTDDRWLQKIGRIHTAQEGIQALDKANRYFTNCSADIILGIDDLQNAENEFKKIKKYVKHISAYLLTPEENTPLYNKLSAKKVSIATEDNAINQYNDFTSIAEEHGFHRYETSNYAMDCFRAKHNSSYWDLTPYIGLGAGAHSFVEGVRYYNESNLKKYLTGNHSGNNKQIFEREKSGVEDEREYIMLALRTKEGIRFERFKQLFSHNFFDKYEMKIKEMEKYIRITDEGVCISPEYFLVQNAIIRSLLNY